MAFEPWDVVAVPFPFTDSRETKRRPALVLSTGQFNSRGHLILAMVTTSTARDWPGDVHLRDLAAAGLPRPCHVRLKLFTLDARLVVRRLGSLSPRDRKAVGASLRDNLV